MDKTKKKTIIIAMAIVGAIILFFVLANFIVLDECASPCRNSVKKGEIDVCSAVCEKVTLLDWIMGNG